ncbi:DUF2927 domain-containing protein [Comamonadaceae bacterium G21597-S1]|nr:DUF2927 domain-containing protein [Comamonadaceae bacterium G21597-S1]
MKRLLALFVLFAAVLPVRADALQDRFDTVWESLWYQGGSPTQVVRWGEEIRVRIRGRNQSTHRGRIMHALGKVTTLAGVRLLDVSEAQDAEKRANLDVQIVDDLDLPDNQACFVRVQEIERSLIVKAELKMRDHAVYQCVLHEAMHAIGISGHPTGDTVLSYFYQRVDALTELDELLVRAWYSEQMRPGMSPLAAVVVLTNAVVRAVPAGPQQQRARVAQRQFLAETLRKMEAFGSNQGEVPVVLKRSGTASSEMIAQGRTLMQFYIGVTYADGVIADKDMVKAVDWMGYAARAGLLQAQLVLGYLYERGEGVEANASEAYVWYSMAAAQDVPYAVESVKRVASVMTPEEVEIARARIPPPR